MNWKWDSLIKRVKNSLNQLEIIGDLHNNAAGFSIKIKNIDKLTRYANEQLKDVNFNEGVYEADFIVNGNCLYLNQMIIDLDRGKNLYGQNCPEPTIIVQNIIVDKKNIQVLGKNKDTLKIIFNGMTYMKFQAEDLIKIINNYKDKISLTVVGHGNINEWGGNITPQIFIEDFEIKEISDIDF